MPPDHFAPSSNDHFADRLVWSGNDLPSGLGMSPGRIAHFQDHPRHHPRALPGLDKSSKIELSKWAPMEPSWFWPAGGLPTQVVPNRWCPINFMTPFLGHILEHGLGQNFWSQPTTWVSSDQYAVVLEKLKKMRSRRFKGSWVMKTGISKIFENVSGQTREV